MEKLLQTFTHISLLFCSYYFLRLITRRLLERSGKYIAIYYGLFYGLLAILTQYNPITLNNGVIIDARNTFVSLSAFLGGPTAAIISFLVASCNRLILGGQGSYTGVLIMGVIAIYGLWLRHFFIINKKRFPSFFEIGCIGVSISFIGLLFAYLTLPSSISLNILNRYLSSVLLLDFVWTYIFWEFEINEVHRLKYNEDLKRHEKILTETQMLAKIGTWELDSQTNLITVSSNAAAILGIASEQKFSIDEFIERFIPHKQDQNVISQSINKSIQDSGKPEIVMFHIKGKDGDIIPVAGKSIIQRDENERVKLIYGFVQDIRERQELREQLKQSLKLATLGELAASIGHDINNPLFVAQANLELLEFQYKDATDQKTKNTINKIKKAMALTQKIVKGLKSYASQDIHLKEPIECHQVIENSIDIFKDIIKLDKTRLNFSFQADTDIIEANESELSQVVLNLLVNSMQATEGVDDAQISIETYNSNQFFNIKVTDNGKGIPTSEIEKIFDSFYTTKKSGEGTGLGLAITRKIVTDSNGKIDVKSIPGKGSIFTVSFPICHFNEATLN